MRFSLDRIAVPFVAFSERFYPDPFVFAIGLTGLAFMMVIGFTPTSAVDALEIWGNGLTGLLSFITQVCLSLVTAHALAHTALVRRAIGRLASRPARPGQAYALVVLIAGSASLLAGALGLVVGALTALEVARQGRIRGLRLHFPLLVASAYSGFLVWHMGYSSTAALSVATPGHVLEPIAGVVPVSETIFAPWNIMIAVVTLAAVACVCSLLAPPDEDIVELPEATDAESEKEDVAAEASTSFGQRLESARILSASMGALLLVYLASSFGKHGFSLTFDVVNWSFLGVGLILSDSPRHYVELIGRASRTMGPIVLQYPLYSGVMALVLGTELVSMLSDGFVAIATPETLGFWAFVSGGILNFLVPSGGGQWVVQGPIFLSAATQLSVDAPVVVMGVAYGDQWTNMIQPFWTLPLLSIVGLSARSIMGYCFLVFLTSFVTFSTGLLLVGSG